jgi:hypothetical protein
VDIYAFSQNSCEVKCAFGGSDVKQVFYNKLLPCTAVYEENKPTRYAVLHVFAFDLACFF